MREFKFRVLNSRGQMIFSEKHYRDDLGMFFGQMSPDGEDVMQYTGLKDKNGVEIYEGDIVTFRDCCGITLTKKVEWIEEDAGFYPFGADYGCGDTVGTDHEVIGNIYSNPELLENSNA